MSISVAVLLQKIGFGWSPAVFRADDREGRELSVGRQQKDCLALSEREHCTASSRTSTRTTTSAPALVLARSVRTNGIIVNRGRINVAVIAKGGYFQCSSTPVTARGVVDPVAATRPTWGAG
jgi:hypothetical protein